MAQNTDNRGQWQAQGDDIANPGHCEPWNELAPPTKSHGLTVLDLVVGRCAGRELKIRKSAFGDARRYVMRLPPDGLPGFSMKSFNVRAPPRNARHARVDLEVTTGRAFVDDPEPEEGGSDA